MYGKSVRMRRLFPDERRKLFSVPLDHAVSMGPIEGLEDVRRLARELVEAGADLLITTPGAAREVAPELGPTTYLGIHGTVSTSLGSRADHKVLVTTVRSAVGLGADLFSVQVNFGTPDEPDMLRSLGIAADECRDLGVPLLCMAYVKKPGPISPDELRHAARAAADLGADIVKTSYPGSVEEFRRLVQTTPVPVLIGGGVRVDNEETFLSVVRAALSAGGQGICIGRNLFQRPPVGPLARRIARELHGNPPAPQP